MDGCEACQQLAEIDGAFEDIFDFMETVLKMSDRNPEYMALAEIRMSLHRGLKASPMIGEEH